MITHFKHALLFAGSILANLAFSQSYTVIPGKEKAYTKEEGVVFKNYLQVDNKTLYIERMASYDNDATEIIHKNELTDISQASGKTAVFNKSKKDGKALGETVLQKVVFNNRVLAACSRVYLNDKKKDFYLKYIDFDGIEKENREQKLLMSEKYVTEKNVYQFYAALFSADKSKLLITRKTETQQKTTYSWVMDAWVFDVANAKQLSEFSIPRFHENLELDIDNILISNNGDLFCPTRMPENTSPDIPLLTSGTKKNPVSPVIFQIKLNEKALNKLKISESPVSFQDFKLKEVKEGIYAYGSLFNKSNNNSEIFYAKIDINLSKVLSFNSAILSPEVNGKLKETERSFISPDKIIVEADHVWVFCQNSFYRYVTTYNGGAMSIASNKEIIIGSFNTINETKKTYLVPKFSTNYLANYHIYYDKENIFLVYVEHPKNIESYRLENYDAKKYNEIVNYNGSLTVCTKISADGIMKRETLFENKGWCFKPENLDVVIEKENALILHMIKGKEERFDKLIFK
jgi:hypothetical protein